MARSGALIPLLVGGAVAAGVVYAMTRDAKAKAKATSEPQLPPGDEAFEPLPSGALPPDLHSKYLQGTQFPADPNELVTLAKELEAFGAPYEAAQIRRRLGAECTAPTNALPDDLQAMVQQVILGMASDPGEMHALADQLDLMGACFEAQQVRAAASAIVAPDLTEVYGAALGAPENFSHADLLDLADDLDQMGANYEAEQIRDLAAALHGVEPPVDGGGAPLADPGGAPPVGLPDDVMAPPGGGFVPPGTMPTPSLWDQLAQSLGQMIPAGLEQPVSLPAPPGGPQGEAPPSLPGDLLGDFAPPPPPRGAPGEYPPIRSGEGTYTIKAGDTLWGLAQRAGDGSRWGELVALNLGRYEPHPQWGLVLHPGDVIQVPADFNL